MGYTYLATHLTNRASLSQQNLCRP